MNDLTLFPRGDADFFSLWGKAGKYYQVTTTTTGGVDTRVRVFDPTGAIVAENDDYTPGNPASRATFMAPGEGWFAVAVDSRAPTDWGCRKYSVTVIDVSPPTPTPTATPGTPPTPTRPATPTPPPTAIPGEAMYDAYEPNAEFGTAANIGVGQTLNLNFNPYPAGSSGVDNDFFRLYVKAGDHLRIETASLAEGLDTNLILYRGDSLAPLLGNDDCQPGERRSCLEWSPDYTGLAYLLAGPVGTIPEAVAAGSRAYTLVVSNLAGQALTPEAAGSQAITAAYGQPLPWAVTPVPPTPAGLLGGTPDWPGGASPATPTAVVGVRTYSLTPPTPTPLPRQGVTVQLTIYYDENDNRGPDPNEGIAGLSIRALDSVSNQAIAQTFTDAYGHATLAVAAAGEVRLSVPYLGYNQAIQPPGKQLFVRLSPMRLPSLIP